MSRLEVLVSPGALDSGPGRRLRCGLAWDPENRSFVPISRCCSARMVAGEMNIHAVCRSCDNAWLESENHALTTWWVAPPEHFDLSRWELGEFQAWLADIFNVPLKELNIAVSL